jgi:hypothetical protein
LNREQTKVNRGIASRIDEAENSICPSGFSVDFAYKNTDKIGTQNLPCRFESISKGQNQITSHPSLHVPIFVSIIHVKHLDAGSACKAQDMLAQASVSDYDNGGF